MKKLIIPFIAILFLLSACKKDVLPPPGHGTCTFDSLTFNTNFGIANAYGYSLYLTSINLLDTFLKAPISAVNLQLTHNNLLPGTYTYLPRDSSTYDSTKNFSGAEVIFDGTLQNRNIQTLNTDSVRVTNINAGTVTIQTTGINTFQITYSLGFYRTIRGFTDSIGISGSYSGYLITFR